MTENIESPTGFELAQEVYSAGREWVNAQVASGEEFQLHAGVWEILADAPREALEAMAFAALRHKMVQRCGARVKTGEEVMPHPLAANPGVWIDDPELGKVLVKQEEGLFIGWDHADRDAKALSAGRREKLGDGSHGSAGSIRESLRMEA